MRSETQISEDAESGGRGMGGAADGGQSSEGGQKADLQGRPDFGPQHETPFSISIPSRRCISVALARSGQSRAAPHTSGS